MSRVKYERASEWKYRVYLIYSVGDDIHNQYHLYPSPSAEPALPSIHFAIACLLARNIQTISLERLRASVRVSVCET